MIEIIIQVVQIEYNLFCIFIVEFRLKFSYQKSTETKIQNKVQHSKTNFFSLWISVNTKNRSLYPFHLKQK